MIGDVIGEEELKNRYIELDITVTRQIAWILSSQWFICWFWTSYASPGILWKKLNVAYASILQTTDFIGVCLFLVVYQLLIQKYIYQFSA